MENDAGKCLKLQLLECIGIVYERSQNCKLDPSFFDGVDRELTLLSDYFKISRSQSVFLSVVLTLNFKSRSVDLDDLIRYFDCNPMKILEYSDDFEVLYSKKILKKQKPVHGMFLAQGSDRFSINEKVTEALLKNAPMPVLENEAFNDVIELLGKINALAEERCDEGITTFYLFDQAEDFLTLNQHLPLIKKMKELNLNIQDSFFYLILIWKTISGKESTDISSAVEVIFDTPTTKVNYIQDILSDKNALVQKNLIEIVEGRFCNDSEMKLTDFSVEVLGGFGLKLFANKTRKDNIIGPSAIQSKALIFNEEESKQLGMLKSLLHEEHFRETQCRLQNKCLPRGITVLLHGLPGTGKTETVFQVAKETNRDIFKVDISQSKSMWFGESEKIIKRVFTEYKSYAKDCEQMPILLFNEADAIISKRKDSSSSNVAQTENAIQNIILEELEKFEGIFFATTNLVKNLDPAFERRFLFKIEFHKPGLPEKAQIWKLKLPNLSLTECETLARSYDFSGGQIDNIVRKNEIHEILHGLCVDFNNLLDFCKTELLFQTKEVKVGFNRAKTE